MTYSLLDDNRSRVSISFKMDFNSSDSVSSTRIGLYFFKAFLLEKKHNYKN